MDVCQVDAWREGKGKGERDCWVSATAKRASEKRIRGSLIPL